jgi:UDP-glucuronate decarboxylase
MNAYESPLHHNNPPPDLLVGDALREKLRDENQDLIKRRDELLAAAGRIPEINSDEIAGRVTDFIKQLLALHKTAEAKRTGAKILLTSTSEVYGDPLVHPQTEDYWGNVNPIGPRACYDEGKRAAETLFFDYHRQHDLRIKVVRLFNTYGPRMHPQDGRVVSNFIMSALTIKPLTVYGEGQQTRSFCYVDDLIDGLVAMMHSGDEVTGPINLGNPGEFTIAELANLVIEQTGVDPGIEYLPLPVDDPVRRQPDITRAKNTLGWAPTIPLVEGLTRTISYFRTSVLG